MLLFFFLIPFSTLKFYWKKKKSKISFPHPQRFSIFLNISMKQFQAPFGYLPRNCYASIITYLYYSCRFRSNFFFIWQFLCKCKFGMEKKKRKKKDGTRIHYSCIAIKIGNLKCKLKKIKIKTCLLSIKLEIFFYTLTSLHNKVRIVFTDLSLDC